MTILEVVSDAAVEVGLSAVSQAVGSSDSQTKQLLSLAIREGKETRKFYNWPKLQKEATITLVDSQEAYALPGDFSSFLDNTHWDRTNRWSLIGPMTPQEWQSFKSGIIATAPRNLFRVKGWANNQFHVFPTPGAGDAGRILAFEYMSRSWIRPRAWTSSTAFAAGTYCSYNGNIYQAPSAGTTGVTPPTHISGVDSDGGMNWTYYSDPYEKPLADTDVCLLDDDIMTLGIKWRWLASKRFSYKEEKMQWWDAMKMRVSDFSGARKLSASREPSPYLISSANVPDTGYGS